MSENLDRRTIAVLVALVVSVLLLIGAMAWSASASVRLSEMNKAHAEMDRVGGELKKLMSRVDSLERRAAASGGKGLLSYIEQIAQSIGVKDKIVSQQSVPSSSQKEEKAELSFQKLSLNEVANLIYRIDAQPVLLIVSRVVMAPSFDEPDLIMLDMTISLVKGVNEN